MVNRGRHRKKKDPYSTILNAFGKGLKYPEAFKCMSVEQIQEILREQQFQGNVPNLKVFEECWSAGRSTGGITWGCCRLHSGSYYERLLSSYNANLFRVMIK